MTSRAHRLVNRFVAALLLALSMALAASSAAGQAAYQPRAEARLRHLAEMFRCLVCQNQSLADSNAELAADLRNQIREQIRIGASDEQIQTYMVRRYGDFVLYRPPIKPVTWALWFGPFITLAAGAVVLVLSIRHARNVRPSMLSQDERRHADAMVDGHNEGARR